MLTVLIIRDDKEYNPRFVLENNFYLQFNKKSLKVLTPL